MKSKCNIIFIIGIEHSGTTILYRMLAQHPRIAWFSQYSLRDGSVPYRFRIPFGWMLNRLGKKCFSPTWKKKFGILQSIIPTPTEPHKIWDFVLPAKKAFLYKEDFSDEEIQRMRATIYKECAQWGKDTLIIKLPRLSRAVDVLAHAFPEAYFVHIVRDGRAVTLSNEHKYLRNFQSEEEAVYVSAEAWKDVLAYIEKQKEKNQQRFLEFCYEDFCNDVEVHLKKVLEYTSVPYQNMFFTKIPRKLKNTNAKWIESCQPFKQKIIDKTLGDTLMRYGYECFDKNKCL